MRGAIMYGPGDVRVEDRDEPRIVEPSDAVIRVSAACVCGSDLWPYRGIGKEEADWPMPMGHEYVGIVEEVGAQVETIEPASSSSARSGRPTTPARSAARATTAPASTGSRWDPSVRRPSSCGCRSPTAPSSRRPTSPPTT